MEWVEWIAIAGATVTAAGTISTVTPTKTDDKIVSAALRVLNIVALNFGRAKNADDKD